MKIAAVSEHPNPTIVSKENHSNDHGEILRISLTLNLRILKTFKKRLRLQMEETRLIALLQNPQNITQTTLEIVLNRLPNDVKRHEMICYDWRLAPTVKKAHNLNPNHM